MNKKQNDVKKPLKKRVFHVVLPVKTWGRFEKWRKNAGFSTTTEAIRYLIRDMASCIFILFMLSGCISNNEFWHKDKRIRIKQTVESPDYNDPELECVRYYLLERWHARLVK